MRKLASAILLFAACTQAQYVDASAMGQPMNLAGNWRFHSGDDPRYSQPGLPDSDWKVISTDVDWYEHGKLWNGTYWYRLHVRLPNQHPPLQLLFDYMGNPYEAYVNGTLVGSFGKFPPDFKVMRPLLRTFPIPDGSITGNQMVIAIRFWTPPLMGGSWGGLRTARPVVLGPADAIQNEYAADRSEILYPWLPDICAGFMSILLALGLLALYAVQRSSEYVWISGYLIAITAWNIFQDLETVVPVGRQTIGVVESLLFNAAAVLLLQFVFAFLKWRIPLWLRIYQWSLPFQIALQFMVNEPGIAPATDLIGIVWTAPYAFLLPGVVLWRYVRGHKEAGLLAIPLLLITFNTMLNEIGQFLFALNLRGSQDDVIPALNWGAVPIYAGQIGQLLFVVSIGGLLLYRFQTASRREAHAKSELEAARSLQEVMVPKRVQEAAGFTIESAYIPAQEVGGDFFQLFPCEDASLLVVIGDVSGKGVKAAMLVSMILGALQRTIETTRSPARVLRDLNRCLYGRTDGHFATCCCALMRSDGCVTAANAGHLSPYCDGAEIELLGGFPLGLSPEAEYEEVQLNLPPGKRWLFISDGVVEARGKTGELYGFERTRSLSVLAVDQVAQTAQQFGQEDDITVLGIERQAVAFA